VQSPQSEQFEQNISAHSAQCSPQSSQTAAQSEHVPQSLQAFSLP
jgi:hypothetical protein